MNLKLGVKINQASGALLINASLVDLLAKHLPLDKIRGPLACLFLVVLFVSVGIT